MEGFKRSGKGNRGNGRALKCKLFEESNFRIIRKSNGFESPITVEGFETNGNNGTWFAIDGNRGRDG
jgi:hypothetical protein